TNWSTGDIYDSANVVDGEWAIENGKLRPQVLDYDRLVAIGDVNWDDYQVTVPFTIHGIDPDPNAFLFPSYGPGVGLILRWQGHYQKTTEQPRIGWEKLGALSWYHWSDVNTAGLQMIGYSYGAQYPGGGNILDSNSSIAPLNYSTEYIYKANVATTADGAIYRFKVWRSDLPEPAVWHMTGTLDDVDDAGHLTSGSMLLVAHHVDVSFGNVTIEPLSAVRQDLDITTVGSGTVDINPSGQTDYLFDSDVELTAVPDPGYRFVEWQEDLSGSTNPQTITMDNDKAVTAVFEALPVLTINTVGNGHVDRNPGGPGYYDVGESVELTAVPDFGYIFTGWSGSIGGITNPQSITMDGDKTVTATFAEITAPLSDNFNRCTPLTVWTTAGVGTIVYNGTQARLTVPSGSRHDLTVSNKDAVRLMQPSENNNFGIEVKFESAVSANSQMQGIVVQQNTNTFLRFDFNSDGTSSYASAAQIAGGSETSKLNVVTSPGGATTWYLRVTRAGDKWTLAYSFNGSNWTTVGNFNYAMTVNSVGVFAGNAGSNPEHTAVVDYFNHTGAPSSDDPLSDQLTVNKVGDGTVNISPTSYGCGDSLTLTAVPADNWEFIGWDGAVSGSNEQVQVTFDVGLAVTANFEQSGSEIYLPFVVKP
ncbi:MAG: DUF1349 domain-containing protein, partial [Anaerolineales bacterium]|nr:DUF1349 domain-containing protein [Anaerolineales bacterium]